MPLRLRWNDRHPARSTCPLLLYYTLSGDHMVGSNIHFLKKV